MAEEFSEHTLSSDPLISVIVICRNEERHLEKCLRALRAQTLESNKFEIIFVDNGSIDASVSIAKNYVTKLIVEPNAKVGALRNLGVSESKGKVLAFIDADCEPCSDWLHIIEEIYAVEPNSVNGSRTIIGESFSWVAKSFSVEPKSGRYKFTSLSTQNLIVSREMFDKVGGFDCSLRSGEDAELIARLAQVTDVYYDSRLRYYHHGEPANLSIFFKRELWHGLGALGSFKVSKIDKPLLATILYSVCLLILSLSLFGIIPKMILATALIVMFLILLFSSLFRRLDKINLRLLVKLLVIYNAYYLARSLSLILLICGYKDYYYKEKKVS